MPCCEIGREGLFQETPRRSSPDEIAGLIDRAPVEAALAVIHAAPRGEASWPPPAMFRALLLAVWCDRSDVRLAEARDDRGSFRRFRGFARIEPTPERSAFVRFRKALVRHGLDEAARWSGHRSRKAIHGYKADVGADADTAIVEKVAVRPGNAHDGRGGWRAPPDDPGEVYAASAWAKTRPGLTGQGGALAG